MASLAGIVQQLRKERDQAAKTRGATLVGTILPCGFGSRISTFVSFRSSYCSNFECKLVGVWILLARRQLFESLYCSLRGSQTVRSCNGDAGRGQRRKRRL